MADLLMKHEEAEKAKAEGEINEDRVVDITKELNEVSRLLSHPEEVGGSNVTRLR